MFSLCLERLYWTELGRLVRRIETKDEAGRDRKGEGETDRFAVDRGDPSGHARDRDRQRDAAENADGAAEKAEHECFAEKLETDVPHPPAERAANADFPGALGYRHDHDVHDADTANKQRDRGDGDE